MISLHRSAVFDDMYMEITARPNLCRDKDAYGVVFRAPNDVAHYRFVAVCDGTAAAERVSLGTPRALQPPTATSDVPVGAPGEVRLGVWAHGLGIPFLPERSLPIHGDRQELRGRRHRRLCGGQGQFAGGGHVLGSSGLSASSRQCSDNTRAVSRPARSNSMRSNKLNDLDARAWLKFQKSWFIHNPPPRRAGCALHPAKFPETLAQEFIEFFTKKGQVVLDPMVGTGSTMVGGAARGAPCRRDRAELPLRRSGAAGRAG